MQKKIRKIKNRANKGITLIALVVTIIVLLILAGISINFTLSNDGLIVKAQESQFKTKLSTVKEQIDIEKLAQLNKGYTIWDLKEQLEKQIQSLQVGIVNAQKGLEIIQNSEGNITDLHEKLQRMHELIIQYSNDPAYQEEIETEMNSLIQEMNELANSTKYADRLFFTGEVNENNPYVIQFGNGYFEQGKIEITIQDLRWSALYGEEEIDYTNQEESRNKIINAIARIGEIRNSLGAKQNAIEHEINQYLPMLEESLSDFYYTIFENTNDESMLVEATKIAKSQDTTVRFLKIAEDSYGVIYNCMQRMQELAVMAINETNEEQDRSILQREIDELSKVIQRKLSYTAIGNKKLFDGSFLAIERTTLNTLGIENFSVLTIEQAEQAIENNASAMRIVSQRRMEIANKMEELQNGDLEQEAQKGYAFEVIQGSSKINEILKDYKDKFQMIAGELTYIGNDEKEKRWALELGIEVQ